MITEISDPSMRNIPSERLQMPEFKTGWLLFQSETTKKRLAPYPDDWRSMPASELEKLCARARTAPTVTSPSLTGEFRRFSPAPEHERRSPT